MTSIRGRSKKTVPRGSPRWRFPSLCGIHPPLENSRVTSSLGVYETGGTPVPGSFLDDAGPIEMISNFGVGYDGIDMKAVGEKGIRVSNTPDVLTEDVADLAISFCLALKRSIVNADRYVRDGLWEKDGQMPFTQRFHGSTVGIAGLGRIGRAVARRLESFGCEICYSDVAKGDLPYRYFSSLVELAAHCNILITTMPGGAETRGVVDREVLLALGAEGYLVNVSRGSVIDESALVAALEAGKIAGAGLDVFANEPHVPEQLKTMSNVILSPHTASGTWQTRNAMRDLVVENLKNFFEGKPLKTPVN